MQTTPNKKIGKTKMSNEENKQEENDSKVILNKKIAYIMSPRVEL